MRADRWLHTSIVVSTVAVSACADAPKEYRGPGLQVAALPANDVVGVYRAALAGSFSLNDPTLFLLADPTLLPRTSGLAKGERMPSELMTALRQTGVVKGTCTVPVMNTRFPLVCPAEGAGYVVRFSQPFAMPGGPDSVQVHLVVQQYATPTGARAERLRFERAYLVARPEGGSAWRAVREARLQQP